MTDPIGARQLPVSGDGMYVDKPVYGGEKAKRRILRKRFVQDGERSYAAYSADELIEIDMQAHHHRRPGLPY